MVWVEALIPFDKGEFLSTIHQFGVVERTVSIVFCTLNKHVVFLPFVHSLISVNGSLSPIIFAALCGFLHSVSLCSIFHVVFH